jgi:hypothetical protein
MTQENETHMTPEGPVPKSDDVQTITEPDGGGWIAVIEGPGAKRSPCKRDYELSGLAGSINERRRQTLSRMGVR